MLATIVLLGAGAVWVNAGAAAPSAAPDPAPAAKGSATTPAPDPFAVQPISRPELDQGTQTQGTQTGSSSSTGSQVSQPAASGSTDAPVQKPATKAAASPQKKTVKTAAQNDSPSVPVRLEAALDDGRPLLLGGLALAALALASASLLFLVGRAGRWEPRS